MLRSYSTVNSHFQDSLKPLKESTMANHDSTRLAKRLHELRTTHPLTQSQVAKALGVSAPSISSWESGKTPKPPPVERLRVYARLFATERSFERGHVRLLGEDELSEAERTRMRDLEQELLAMHPALQATVPYPVPAPTGWPLDDFWHFAENPDITIVCAPLPDSYRDKMLYADPRDPDFVKLHTYADLDALLELYGHVRAVNPFSNVNVRLASELSSGDYTAHLVVLGGVDWNHLTRELLNDADLPVRQVPSDNPGGAAFEVLEDGNRRLFCPIFDDGNGKHQLVEDIAHFYRGPNPFNTARTVTICNGVFGRGVFAGVRSLTDVRLRRRNALYVHDRFGGTHFSLLARVRIRLTEAVTPDWSSPVMRLHEWPTHRLTHE
jgi:transcriptional regulator with XRE-family HTH domain